MSEWFVSRHNRGRTSIAEAIDDLIDDEENIKDAEYLVDSMNESSKSHWINGFDKHPDPDYTLRHVKD